MKKLICIFLGLSSISAASFVCKPSYFMTSSTTSDSPKTIDENHEDKLDEQLIEEVISSLNTEEVKALEESETSEDIEDAQLTSAKGEEEDDEDEEEDLKGVDSTTIRAEFKAWKSKLPKKYRQLMRKIIKRRKKNQPNAPQLSKFKAEKLLKKILQRKGISLDKIEKVIQAAERSNFNVPETKVI